MKVRSNKVKKTSKIIPFSGDSSPQAGNKIRNFSSTISNNQKKYIVKATDSKNKPVTIEFFDQNSLLEFLKVGKIYLRND